MIPCFPVFADLLSLHLITFLMFFDYLYLSFFQSQVHAWAEVCNIRLAEVCPHSQQASLVDVSFADCYMNNWLGYYTYMQHWLKNQWPRHLFKDWVNSSLDCDKANSPCLKTGDTRIVNTGKMSSFSELPQQTILHYMNHGNHCGTQGFYVKVKAGEWAPQF